MIGNQEIKQYLEKVSKGIQPKGNQMSAEVWDRFYEYIVAHYNRLDNETRAYADEIFDQMEASIEEKIDSLPEGRQKKGLSRKLCMVRGERCPLPVLFLDITVLENIMRHALGQAVSHPYAAYTEALYDKILTLVKAGKIIYPENSFYTEALYQADPHSGRAIEVMRRLSHGLSFRHSQAIEDFQVFRALRSFINGNKHIACRKFWKDAFYKETVDTIRRECPFIVFDSIPSIPEKIGERAIEEPRSGCSSTRLRIRYDQASERDEQQLQQQSTRHLRDLVRLGMKYQKQKEKRQTQQHISGFWAGQKTDLAVALWNQYGGEPEGIEGLTAFYESEHFTALPAFAIKRDIWNAFSVYHAGYPGKLAGPADINIISYLLPYTDIMILNSRMTGIVRDTLRLDAKFDTRIYSIDEYDQIMNALKEGIWPD